MKIACQQFGSEYDPHIIQVDGAFVKIHMTDISGQNHFLRLNQDAIKDADGYMFVYDVTSEESFESMKDWLRVCSVLGKKSWCSKGFSWK